MKNYKLTGLKVIMTVLALSFSCSKVDNFFTGHNGLVAVNLKSSSVMANSLPGTGDCQNLTGKEKVLCIAKKYCASFEGWKYGHCHADTMAMFNQKSGQDSHNEKKKRSLDKRYQKERNHEHGDRGKKGGDGQEDDEDDDHSSNVSYPPYKLMSQIAAVDLYNDADGWVSVDMPQVGSKDESEKIDLLDTNLNLNIARGKVPSGTYTKVRVTFGDENTLMVHQSEMDGMPQTYTEQEGQYFLYSMKYAAPQAKALVIEKEIIVEDIVDETSLDVLELDIVPDTVSLYEQSGEDFIFTPFATLAGIKGGGYIQPNEPVNVSLDGGAVTVSAPAGISTEPVKITAQPLTAADLPAADSQGNSAFLGSYNFGPNRVFLKPLTLSLPYDAAALGAAGLTEQNIQVLYYNESLEEWKNVPSFSVDQNTQKVNIETRHFTIYKVVGQSGFRMIIPGAVSAKIDYDFFNYLADKLIATQVPVLETSKYGQKQSSSTSIYSYQLNIIPKDIDVHSLGLNINSTGTTLHADGVMLKVRLYLKAPVPLGTLKIHVVDKFFGTSLVNINRPYELKSFNVALKFLVTKNPQTGNISFTYSGEEGASFDLNGSSNYGTFWNWVISLGDVFLDNWWAQAIMVGHVTDKIGPKLEDVLNTTFAESVPMVNNLTFDSQGIAYTQDVDTGNFFAKISDFSANCATPPQITTPASNSNSPIQLTNGNFLGAGISLNVFNELFTEIANRGFFCYNGVVNTAGDILQITPNGPAEASYAGNYLYKISLPVEILLNGVAYQRKLAYKYRIVIPRGMTNVQLDFLGLADEVFNAPYSQVLSDYAQKFLDLKAANPGTYSVVLNNINPAGYSGLHPTMFQVAEPNIAGGRLNFQAKIQGLKYNYEKSDTSAEWIWTRSYGYATDRCAKHLRGILRRPTSTSYEIEISNGSRLPLLPSGVSLAMLNHFSDKTVSLQGACSKGNFLAYNVIAETFYTSDEGLALYKQNYAAQLVSLAPPVPSAFARTTHLLFVDMKGDNVPEILQIIRIAGGGSKFVWYLNKMFTVTDPAQNIYVTNAPWGTGNKPIYRVAANIKGVRKNQVLINCTVYDIASSGGKVSMSESYDYCSPPAGWIWKSGSNQPNDPGNYGTKILPSVNNVPRSRAFQVSWSQGGNYWMFGGDCEDQNPNNGLCNDLWRYNYSTGLWTWMNGSSLTDQMGIPQSTGWLGNLIFYMTQFGVSPSARRFSASAVMSQKLYLFGGHGMQLSGGYRQLSDLWEYNPAMNQWTNISGINTDGTQTMASYGTKGVSNASNHPPGRSRHVMWEANGYLWVFGGLGSQGKLNDLWKFNPVTREWTWVRGSNSTDQAGVYGTKGVFAPENTPGARDFFSMAKVNGKIYLYGGHALDANGIEKILGDMWVFDPVSEQWAWISGSSAMIEAPLAGTSGAFSATFTPGARNGHSMVGGVQGELYLFGGFNPQTGMLSDVWKFDTVTGQWAYIGTSQEPHIPASYGYLNEYQPANTPGGRSFSSLQLDSSGNFWLFGGVFDMQPSQNDLWMFRE